MRVEIENERIRTYKCTLKQYKKPEDDWSSVIWGKVFKNRFLNDLKYKT